MTWFGSTLEPITRIKERSFRPLGAVPWIVTNRISNVLYHIQPHGNWNKNKFLILAAIDRLRRYHGSHQEGSPTAISTKAGDYVMEDEFCEQAEGIRRTSIQPFSPMRNVLMTLPKWSNTYSAPVPHTVQEVTDFGEDLRRNAASFLHLLKTLRTHRLTRNRMNLCWIPLLNQCWTPLTVLLLTLKKCLRLISKSLLRKKINLQQHPRKKMTSK